jgi:hypothetical protein
VQVRPLWELLPRPEFNTPAGRADNVEKPAQVVGLHADAGRLWLALEMAAKPAGELFNFVCLLKSRDRNREVAGFFYVVPEFIRE